MAGTEIYLAVKGANGEIAGEAIADGFVGQINVDSWKWKLHSNVGYLEKREAAQVKGQMSRMEWARKRLEGKLGGGQGFDSSSGAEEELADELPEDETETRPVFEIDKRTDFSSIGLTRALLLGEVLEMKLTMLHRVEEALSVVVILKKARIQKIEFSTKAEEGPVGLDEKIQVVAETVEFRYQKRGERTANRVFTMNLGDAV